MSHILTPFGDTQESNTTTPLIFLAGPIQGAPDWQKEALAILRDRGADLASPRSAKSNYTEDDYMVQVDWEHKHLERASKNGVVMFWLANEAEHIPGRSYAQTSRFELGWHFEKALRNECRLVVGIDTNFPNARYLRYTIEALSHGSIPITNTLIETCETAFAALKKPVPHHH